MMLRDYLDRLISVNKQKITAFIGSLSRKEKIYARMIDNLFRENRLTVKDWDELFSRIISKSLGGGKIHVAITAYCRDRILSGKNARIPSNGILGRAISFDRLCHILVKLKYYSDFEEAKADLRNLIGMDLKLTSRRWKDMELGRYIMWSTFNPDGGTPFADKKKTTSQIICCLGLEPIKGPILLLEYRLPEEIKPKIPTFCDAYAGSVWPKYFLRCNSTSLYGITMPTEVCKFKKGVPEVVHKVIQAKDLVVPLRRG